MIDGFSLNYRVSKLDAYSIQLFTATMVLMYRKANGHRVKCVLPMPLLAGFVFGILSVYAYRFQLDYRNQKKTTPLKSIQDRSQLDLNYHRVDWTKPIVHYHNTSIFCLIFINDIDSVLMQHNLWLVKCANDNVWLIYENLLHLIALLNVNKHQNNYYAGQYIDGVLSIDAGVLLSTNVLTALVNLFRNVDACNSELFNSESQMLDFYLRELNNITPVDNMDLYGCSLFHSINLSDAFNEKSLMPKMSKVCMSKSAITFKLGLTSNSIGMFYKYALYKIRLVTKQDLMYNASKILPVSSLEDKNIWWIEAFYELNFDPRNMSQTDFFATGRKNVKLYYNDYSAIRIISDTSKFKTIHIKYIWISNQVCNNIQIINLNSDNRHVSISLMLALCTNPCLLTDGFYLEFIIH